MMLRTSMPRCTGHHKAPGVMEPQDRSARRRRRVRRPVFTVKFAPVVDWGSRGHHHDGGTDPGAARRQPVRFSGSRSSLIRSRAHSSVANGGKNGAVAGKLDARSATS
jgi:hypothetical protein